MATQKRRREQWMEICAQWKTSSLSRREFAKQHGLVFQSFTWWCTHLGCKQDKSTVLPSKAGFVEVVTPRRTSPQKMFPSAVEDTASGVVVRLGDVCVDFGTNLPPTWWVVEVAKQC
jgi:hypothetical protein